MKSKLFALLVLAAPSLTLADPLTPVSASVQNPTFSIPDPSTPAGDPVSTAPAASGTGWNSASAYWSTWANSPNTQIVSWLTDGPDGLLSNLVFTGGLGDGLVQVLADGSGHLIPQGQVTDKNQVNAWVYVVRGRVGVQLGDGGDGGGASAVSTTTGKWEQLVACGRSDMRNNELTLYSDGPAVFYVSKVSVSYSGKCH